MPCPQPVMDALLDHLRRYCPSGDRDRFLFTSRSGRAPLRSNFSRDVLRPALRRAVSAIAQSHGVLDTQQQASCLTPDSRSSMSNSASDTTRPPSRPRSTRTSCENDTCTGANSWSSTCRQMIRRWLMAASKLQTRRAFEPATSRCERLAMGVAQPDGNATRAAANLDRRPRLHDLRQSQASGCSPAARTCRRSSNVSGIRAPQPPTSTCTRCRPRTRPPPPLYAAYATARRRSITDAVPDTDRSASAARWPACSVALIGCARIETKVRAHSRLPFARRWPSDRSFSGHVRRSGVRAGLRVILGWSLGGDGG